MTLAAISPDTSLTAIPGSNYVYNLGPFSRPISTSSSDAQIWFDRGLIWAYAFNHLESARCFELATLHDPICAMAYWGLAYSSGPNYNKPWELFDKDDLRETLLKTRQAARKARELSSRKGCEVSDVERALIEAIQYRYQEGEDYMTCNKDYAREMTKVYNQFGGDIDVATLYADSLMNLAPWDLWDMKTGEPRKECRTLEAKSVLEKVFDQDPLTLHPGIIHLYIHLMEMSPTPELALPHANRLRGLIPDAGHLHHMPSHLDLLIGDWRSAVASNLQAIIADEKYAKYTSSLDFYTFYRLHDYNTLIYAAMHSGQYAIAMDAVERMEEAVSDQLLRVQSPPMADWLEVTPSTRAHVLVRFGKWEDIISLPLPEDKELYCVTTATVHYAKGIAYSALGHLDKAEEQRGLFHSALAKVPSTRIDYPNKCVDILRVGKAMLDGELEYRRARTSAEYESAFEHLRESIRLADNLTYTEPPAWRLPPRHAYAALQLEQGNVEEASEAYAADLGLDQPQTLMRPFQHPNNIWALHGYHECLIKLGPSRAAEARIIKQQLTLALAIADVPINASCYCRRETESSEPAVVAECACE